MSIKSLRCVGCMNLRPCEPEGIIKTSKACIKWQPNWRVLGTNLYLAYKTLLKMSDSDFLNFKLYWNDKIDIDYNSRKVSKDLRVLCKLIESDSIDVDTDDAKYMNHFINEASVIREKLKGLELTLNFDKSLRMKVAGETFAVKIISAHMEGVELLSKEGLPFQLTYSTVKELQQSMV